MAALIPMTKMPERIALSHAFGGLAAALVGVCHYSLHSETLSHGTMAALGFEVLFGGLTFTGSLVAFGKLQGFVPGRNITYPFQNESNIGTFALTVVMLVAQELKAEKEEMNRRFLEDVKLREELLERLHRKLWEAGIISSETKIRLASAKRKRSS